MEYVSETDCVLFVCVHCLKQIVTLYQAIETMFIEKRNKKFLNLFT